jgi:hypothetical protein
LILKTGADGNGEPSTAPVHYYCPSTRKTG